MDWRVKATLQGAFSRMPYGDRVNFLFQRYVTHSLPASDRVFIEAIQTARDHLGAIERNSAIEEETVDRGQDDLAVIDDLPPAERFARYSRTDLALRDGWFVAKRKSS
jgi:hypothetical protein